MSTSRQRIIWLACGFIFLASMSWVTFFWKNVPLQVEQQQDSNPLEMKTKGVEFLEQDANRTLWRLKAASSQIYPKSKRGVLNDVTGFAFDEPTSLSPSLTLQAKEVEIQQAPTQKITLKGNVIAEHKSNARIEGELFVYHVSTGVLRAPKPVTFHYKGAIQKGQSLVYATRTQYINLSKPELYIK